MQALTVPTWGARVRSDFRRNRAVYLIVVPVIAYYLLFHYGPMYGAIIAFKRFSPVRGILGSPWVGFAHFEAFFSSYYFWRVLRNTVVLSAMNLAFGFPVPIILALLINEVRSNRYKRTVQTVTYLPHFISLVVVAGLIINFTSTNGLITDIAVWFGAQRRNLLLRPENFRTIYVVSEIWQNAGWGAIIYLAALSGVDMELYEAAKIDGARRLRQIVSITLPAIAPTIVILLILRIGRIMELGFEKVLLLYNPAIYETADIIATFVYRRGLEGFDYSYSAAVGLFNSVINFSLVIGANWVSRRVNETSLW